MKSHYRAVVIGGGVVGASVLYHLAKLGWSDVALIERKELTAGSTWHAAAGFHAINADPNIAALQGYTIKLYKEIERESGQSCGLHMTDLLLLALRETGHTIGLADSLDADSMMCRGDASATLRPTLLWRHPRADDIAGARFLYGPARPDRP